MFHFSEFFVTAISNNDSLRPDSFLLNHSKAYWTAAVASWIEFWIEAYLFPSLYSEFISYLGLAMCITGEIFRKLAMCHASTGFTHQIAVRRQKNHTLITWGVYGIVRHPGYLGWFLWSIGTQVN
uniref:Protein-S-isoprenylcysteine O-methyltransferase n=1 Tax=Acrobeloides nanus TaxID=290746 RepID=A0A914DDE0_9BILA